MWWLQWSTGSAGAKSVNVVTTAGTTEVRVSATIAQGTEVASSDSIVFTGGRIMDLYADFPVKI
jgi:hypothetical protein